MNAIEAKWLVVLYAGKLNTMCEWNGSKCKGLVAVLTREILGGKFVPLGSFPSERALAMRFGVSRQTIRQVVKELNRRGLIYSRQGMGTFLTRSGRNLREKVGLILTGERRTEIGREIREELVRLANRMGQTLLFGDASSLNAEACAQSALRWAKKFAEEKVSGVILQPVEFLAEAERWNAEIMSVLDGAGVPVVLVDCDVVSGSRRSRYDVVGIDNFQAGRMLAEHLLEMGAKNMVFLAQANYPPTISERIDGVRDALNGESGVSLITLPDLSVKRITTECRRHPGFDAIVCQNDIAAVNVISALRELRKRVPEDVLVAGFDDVACAPLVEPSLTTIRQPCKHIASRAFDLLLSRVAKTNVPSEFVCIMPKLTVRKSTSRLMA